MAFLKKILVPTDYSPNADWALKNALHLASRTGARLLIIHAVAPHEAAYFAHVGANKSAMEVTDERARLAAHVDKKLGRTSVRHEVEVVFGDPPQQIIRTASERGCDVIVMGTCGCTQWEKLLMGNVAEKVTHLSERPVLLIPPEKRMKASLARSKRSARKRVATRRIGKTGIVRAA